MMTSLSSTSLLVALPRNAKPVHYSPPMVWGSINPSMPGAVGTEQRVCVRGLSVNHQPSKR